MCMQQENRQVERSAGAWDICPSQQGEHWTPREGQATHRASCAASKFFKEQPLGPLALAYGTWLSVNVNSVKSSSEVSSEASLSSSLIGHKLEPVLHVLWSLQHVHGSGSKGLGRGRADITGSPRGVPAWSPAPPEGHTTFQPLVFMLQSRAWQKVSRDRSLSYLCQGRFLLSMSYSPFGQIKKLCKVPNFLRCDKCVIMFSSENLMKSVNPVLENYMYAYICTYT